MHHGSDAVAFFAQMSRELLDEPQEPVTLQRIAERSVDALRQCDWASISWRQRRGRLATVVSTDDRVRAFDEWQYELGEGPCLDVTVHEECYLVEDVRSDGRWPRWTPRVAEAGCGSVLSVRLATESQILGALNLYAARARAFDRDDVDLVLIFASHATAAANAARLVTGLQTAAQTRHLIGVAQGIIMQRYDMGMEAAFEVLRRYSSHANVKLREVAAMVVEQRLLPERYDDLEPPPGSGAAT